MATFRFEHRSKQTMAAAMQLEDADGKDLSFSKTSDYVKEGRP